MSVFRSVYTGENGQSSSIDYMRVCEQRNAAYVMEMNRIVQKISTIS